MKVVRLLMCDNYQATSVYYIEYQFNMAVIPNIPNRKKANPPLYGDCFLWGKYVRVLEPVLEVSANFSPGEPSAYTFAAFLLISIFVARHTQKASRNV